MLAVFASFVAFEVDAMLGPIPREELIRTADMIAVGQVTKIRRRPEADLPHTLRMQYLVQEAELRLGIMVKGESSAMTVTVAFDNSLGCPNVLYDLGATYLVFLVRQADGTFETINHEDGQLRIISDRVLSWWLNDSTGDAISDVVRDIHGYIGRDSKGT